MKLGFLSAGGAVALAMGGLALPASAAVLTFALNTVFSGTTPTGSPPWLTATFTDTAGPAVTLNLATTNISGSEFISEWAFNIDPTLDVTKLLFSSPTKVGTFDTPAISQIEDDFKADGDGKYDFVFSFSTANNASQRFDAGDALSYTITYNATPVPAAFKANAFVFLSTHSGGAGEYFSAGHVQGIGADSGWIGYVPEPSSLAVFGVAGLGLLRRRH